MFDRVYTWLVLILYTIFIWECIINAELEQEMKYNDIEWLRDIRREPKPIPYTGQDRTPAHAVCWQEGVHC